MREELMAECHDCYVTLTVQFSEDQALQPPFCPVCGQELHWAKPFRLFRRHDSEHIGKLYGGRFAKHAEDFRC